MPRDPNAPALPAGCTAMLVLIFLVAGYFAWHTWDLNRERPNVFKVEPVVKEEAVKQEQGK